MNSAQQAYIERLLHVLGSVTEACRHNERAEQFVGRKKVGDHVVKVTLVAERQGIGMPARSEPTEARPARLINQPPLYLT